MGDGVPSALGLGAIALGVERGLVPELLATVLIEIHTKAPAEVIAVPPPTLGAERTSPLRPAVK